MSTEPKCPSCGTVYLYDWDNALMITLKDGRQQATEDVCIVPRIDFRKKAHQQHRQIESITLCRCVVCGMLLSIDVQDQHGCWSHFNEAWSNINWEEYSLHAHTPD